MKSTMKHVTTVVLSLVVLGSVFAIAQAVNVPISMAPNDKIDGITSYAVTGPLSINTATLPGTGVGLNVAGLLKVERDYFGKPDNKHNCLLPDGNNKCFKTFKLFGSTGAARADYPDMVSTSPVNFSGQSSSGVVVLGKVGDSNVENTTFPTLTAGTKLDIAGTGTTLQGDPGTSYMNAINDTTRVVYSGCPVTVTQPDDIKLCKKIACIDTTGNIITCPDAGTATNYTPQRPACSDGIDNDGDGMTDGADLGCWCSNSYSQTGARSCGAAATESSTNNPTCPTPC